MQTHANQLNQQDTFLLILLRILSMSVIAILRQLGAKRWSPASYGVISNTEPNVVVPSPEVVP